MRLVLLFTILVILGSAGNVSAAPKHAQSPKAHATELFNKSADAYLHGDFAEAIRLLDEAYALDPQAVLLYNKARAHEGLGHTDEAIALYEQYLKDDPSSRDRGAIEQRLTTLRRQRDEKNAAEKNKTELEQERAKPPPPPVVVRQEAPPPKRSVGPYVVTGLGILGVGAGTVFGLMATSGESSAQDEPIQSRAIDKRDDAQSLATFSNVGFIAGAVLIAAGVIWWIADTPKKRSATTVGSF